MRQAQMRIVAIIGGLLWLTSIGNGRAEQGFDEKYQRNFNIFTPINEKISNKFYSRIFGITIHASVDGNPSGRGSQAPLKFKNPENALIKASNAWLFSTIAFMSC